LKKSLDAGRPFKFGLEAGSKPELFAALAVHRDPEGLTICNGYKDPTFIKNALQFIDVGGGLGVDYDGSRTAFDSSMNDTLRFNRRKSGLTTGANGR
jgi:arginine decarboxylase-like protein